ncbi:MAG: type IV pilus assembly protein PilM [Verrucomicrobia bacterium]|nr:MAG: type IV pilus assembly protein PilM [Verrucomicrobiota bacterium]
MADTLTTIALNIGSQRIGMAVFETAKNGGLLLKSYASETIVADPALESSRSGQTRVAVADLAQRLKVSRSKVRYAISGQAVFTRFVKLPPLQDDNIEQLVAFEAQQHVPFPINEVVWDYEIIEGTGDKEVVIVAIKSEALDEINASVNECGLSTAEVDVAPMALFNAFLNSYGQPQEPVLLIDIGAKTSNLLYLEGKRFFTRSIPVGGTAVTSAIAKEYGVSFLEAEHQKITHGLVALGGGHTEQLDESVAALAMVIRNALTRLPSEIARTTNYYRSQHGGNAPKRIYLCGGGANLPYTLEFFEEKLNLPIEFFNPLKTLAVGKGVDTALLQREAHLMGELVGLGLRGIGKSAINIDLVPAVVEQIRAADRRKPLLIGAAAVFIAGVATWSALQMVAAGRAQDKTRTMQESSETLAPLADDIGKLLKTQEALQAVASNFTTAEADHAFWPDLLSELTGALASDAVWITDLEPLKDFNALDPDPKPPAINGSPVVKADFASGTYGSSGFTELTRGEQAEIPAKGTKSPATAPSTGAVNAVRIRGFWRENPDSQNAVSKLLKRLRDKPGAFSFTVTGADHKPIALKDEQILKVNLASADGGELAFPFTITLPLAREVRIK